MEFGWMSTKRSDDTLPWLLHGGYLRPGEQLHRRVLFDALVALPRDPEVKVMIFHAEIAPEGHTNWHRHNGTTFFVALQGRFEAEFKEGVLVRAEAGDVYSEPIGAFHRGRNPDPEVPYLCIGVCLTPPDLDHVTNVDERPW
jgi:quercetin dioxygenase-like cupin family protein